MAKKVKTERKVESVVKPYELMLILSPDLRESDIKKKLKEISDMIEKEGGKITNEDLWGKRELAYRIKQYNEGIYVVYNIELPNSFLNELKHHLRIEKDVLRSMILTLPADYTYTKYDLEVPKEERQKKEKVKKVYKKEEKVEVTPIKEEKVEEAEEPKVTAETPGDAVETQEPASPEEEKEKEEPTEKPADEKNEEDTHVPSTGDKEEEKPEEPAEEKEEKEEEKDLTDEELEEKKRESELDKKLDELLGGDDLKL